MKPTDEQQAIIDAFETGDDIRVQAAAGSGKTSTLLMLAKAKIEDDCLYIAYNKAIQSDMASRSPFNLSPVTSHSLAFAAVGRNFKDRLNGPRLNSTQTASLLGIKPFRVSEERPLLNPFVVTGLVNETVRNFTYSSSTEITDVHVPDVTGYTEADMLALRDQIVPYAKRAWVDLTNLDGKLFYSHDAYLKTWALSRPKLTGDVLMVDEAQDANGALIGVVNDQDHMQRVVVGDSCQPTGTLVTVVRQPGAGKRATITEEIPIEQLREGDHVVSFNQQRAFLRRTGSEVSGISSRPYVGELIRVTTSKGRTSAYTPDHHCLVHIGPALKGRFTLYMMRRGNDFRIGICQGLYESQHNAAGFALRAISENADAAWILDTFETRADAIRAEAVAAWSFGVPDLIFQEAGHSMSQSDLDKVWSEIGNNRYNADRLLAHYGRRIDFPLIDRGKGRMLVRRSQIIRACNLLPGMTVLPIEGAFAAGGKRAAKMRWEPVTVTRELYDGPVYSMTVENDHTYVGDGIITHNCQQLYAWRGAQDALKALPGREFPLSQSFRFGEPIADEANMWLNELDAPLRVRGYDQITSHVTRDLPGARAVLCRTNMGCMGEAMTFMDAGRKVSMVGGTQQIDKLAKACLQLQEEGTTTHPELIAFKSWDDVVAFSEESNGSDLKPMVGLIQRYGAKGVLYATRRFVDESQADVIVSTAHKAKGREWTGVRIGEDFHQEPDPEDGLIKITRADAMLAYVSVTRAREDLGVGGLDWIRYGDVVVSG